MIRPLFPVLFGVISGILSEYYLGIIAQWFTPRVSLSLVAVYSLLWLLWYGCYRRNFPRLSTSLLVILAMLFGMIRYAESLSIPPHHIAYLAENTRVTIEGWVYKPTERFGKMRYVYIETTWVERGAVRFRTCGKIRMTLTGDKFSDSGTKTFAYGDTIRTRLMLRPPKDSTDFDYRGFLRRQGVYLLGTLQHDRYIIKLPEEHGYLLVKAVDRIRDRMLRFLDEYVSEYEGDEQEIQIIKAITIGSCRELSEIIREKFRNAGTYHILVVSGMHIGILVWLLHHLLNLLFFPPQYRIVLLIPLLLFYSGITGNQFPVIRSVIMALVWYFSITCNRIAEPVYSLAFSIGVILIMFPTAMFDVSFQLTIAATAPILMMYRCLLQLGVWQKILRTSILVRLPMTTFLISLAATIGTAPVLVIYFQQISPYALPSNILVLPIVTLFLPFSLTIIFLSLLIPWSALYPLLFLNILLAKCFLWLTVIVPETDLTLPPFSNGLMIAYYAALYCVFNVHRVRVVREFFSLTTRKASK